MKYQLFDRKGIPQDVGAGHVVKIGAYEDKNVIAATEEL
jgi:hypothetical protein